MGNSALRGQPLRGGKRQGRPDPQLEAFCRPTGLYPSCSWDVRVVRRAILNGKLAPRMKGTDAPASLSDDECPICFFYYGKVSGSSLASLLRGHASAYRGGGGVMERGGA
eukprot:scaffold1130_cov195-Pinguiococcus_pyrenoidosus.AAC.68